MNAPSGKYIKAILADKKKAKELMANLIIGSRRAGKKVISVDGRDFEIVKVNMYQSGKQ